MSKFKIGDTVECVKTCATTGGFIGSLGSLYTISYISSRGELAFWGYGEPSVNNAINDPDRFKLYKPDIKTNAGTGGTKHDDNKVRLDLLPPESLEEIAKVLTFGARKYASFNWCKGISFSRLIGAALRHMFAWIRGEDADPESGLSHLAHLGCCVLFLLWMQKHRPDLDDRFKPSASTTPKPANDGVNPTTKKEEE